MIRLHRLAPAVAVWLMLTAMAHAEPMSLADALRQAMAHNPSIANQDVQVRQADIDYWRAQFQRASLSLDLNGGDNYTVSGMTTASQKDQNVLFVNANSTLRVPLFTGWRITGSIERAEQGVAERKATLFATRQNVALSVIEAYWDNQRQQKLYLVNQDQVKQAEEIHALAKTRLRAGAIAPIDVNRAEVTLISAQAGLIRNEGNMQVARARLGNLLFRNDDTWTLSDDPQFQAIPDEGREIWLARALRQRPEVQAADARLNAGKAGLTIARSKLFPEFALTAQYQYGNNPFRPLASSNNVLAAFEGTFDGRATMTYNLFDNAETWRRMQEAALTIESAELDLTQTKRQIKTDVDQAHAQLTSAASRLSRLRRSIEIARSTRDIMAMRYKLGAAVITDVNDVQRALVSALTENLEATIDYLVAAARLYQAVGRPLAEPSALPPTPAPTKEQP
ncbi:MAG: TolC family protein [Candidatus Sericytochromatia bacterium]|nr:TolC family protein [Candidatus Sericytochromatia bacterium]